MEGACADGVPLIRIEDVPRREEVTVVRKGGSSDAAAEQSDLLTYEER
jgi:hypothetical protein